MKNSNNFKETICLNMIVKDESHIIVKTLENLCSYIKFDYYVICDTGSSDNTKELITEFFQKNNIQGQILDNVWKDFGHNRTLALQAAYNKTDYLLVFDADDSINGDFILPNKLTHSCYKLKFGSYTDTSYYRPLLLNNRLKWKFVGVLHEYLQIDQDIKNEPYDITGNYYLVSGRTGSRNKDPDKYKKDAKILEDAYNIETETSLKERYAFYCAQSYKDANIADKAINWYEKVINELNNWTQEKYYSCIMIGQLYIQNNNIQKALEYYNKSVQFDNDRIECIVNMAQYFYNIKAYSLVVGLYNLYKNYSKPHLNQDKFTNKLFLEANKYCDILEYYTSIAAFYSNFYDIGLKAISKIIQNKIIPLNYYHVTISNLQHYKDYLSHLDDNTLLLIFDKVNNVYQQALQENNTELIKKILNTWKMLYTTITPKITGPHKNIEQLNNRFKKRKDVKIFLSFTTCKRYNLFTQTINSIINTWLDIDNVDYWFCVDDNSSHQDRMDMLSNYPWINYIFKKEKQKGHRESMNIIWNKLNELKPKYWIHIEDDFLFFTKENYIKLGIECLEKYKNMNVQQVLFNRSYAETIDDYDLYGTIKLDDKFLLHEHKLGNFNYKNCHYWKHYSLRPSIINVNSILELGNYNSSNTFFEADYAQKWIDKGYKSAFFNAIICSHIGRLTTDRNTTIKNAYNLNDETQFAEKKKNIKIINLERRPDRKKDMIQKLTVVGYKETEYEFYNAIDGKNLTATQEIYDLFKDNDFNYRKSFIGCALSHLNLWQQLLQDSENDYYIILEDDIVLTENFKEKMLLLESKGAFNKCEVLFLGYSMFSNDRESSKHVYLNNNSPFISKLNIDYYIGGLFMYSISKQGAIKYIKYINNNGIKHGIDYLMVKLHKQHQVELYETQPHLCFSDWNEGGKIIDTNIQNDYSTFNFENMFNKVFEQFIFIKNYDQINYDLYRKREDLIKMLTNALADENCVAVNTLGFFKYNIVKLNKSVYLNNDKAGIYIKKSFYEEFLNSNNTNINIKMLCNWGTTKTVSKEWSTMCTNTKLKTWKSNNTNTLIRLVENDEEADYFVIINSTTEKYEPKKTLVFQMEPWVYDNTKQWGVKTWGEWAKPSPDVFLHVHSHDTHLNAVQWHINISDTNVDERLNKTLCILSDKNYDQGHKYRIDLVKHLIEVCDVYGRNNYHNCENYKGKIPDDKKENVYKNYKYVISVENNWEKNYATEKIWECILSECLCFYWGCPNLEEYLNKNSFIRLDKNDIEKSIQIIHDAIKNNEWEKRIEFIKNDKQRILNELGFFPKLNELIKKYTVIDFKNFTLFDVFLKKDKLYLNLSINNIALSENEIELYIDGKKLSFNSKIIKDEYEPTLLLIYNVEFITCQQYVEIKYSNKTYCIPFTTVNITSKQNNIVLTTLFKDDYKLFPIFYDYYKNQGISHFYMYYNGKITQNIKSILDKPDVTLIEWDYNYWNVNCKYAHHAQMGQLHNAIYKYGKDKHQYIICCDLDEYLHIPNKTIKQFINDTHKDCYIFHNIWSSTLDGNIPDVFPNKFLISKNKSKFGIRTKCIYNLDIIRTVGIHQYKNYTKLPTIIHNLDMYHFYNWSNPLRENNIDNENIENWIIKELNY
jgi:GR25 family glycosyltransferase involved in LPS biosynthesis